MLYLSVRDRFKREVGKNFDSKVEMDKRLTVISDLEMFRPKEDKFVWGQKKGKLPQFFQVSVDGVHICTFNETDSVERAMLLFWKGFREAYTNHKIRLNPPRFDEVLPKPETAKDKLKKIKPTTKAERMAKEVVTRIVDG